MKLVIEVPDDKVVEAMREAGRSFDLKLKDGAITDRALGVAIEDDMRSFFLGGMSTWFYDGINADKYLQFYQEE